MTTRRPTLGLLGYGSFGRFAAPHLSPHFEVRVWDPAPTEEPSLPEGLLWSSPETCASSDFVIPAVPAQALESAVESVRPHLSAGTVVIDVCSVKSRPERILERLLPEDVAFVGTHPMFGPESGKHGIRGLQIVLCQPTHRPVAPDRLECVRSFLTETLGLDLVEMTAEEHDREIAYVQGLTHWMAKALRELGMPEGKLATSAYRHMLKIEQNLRFDSDELFLTIQRENPFASEARERLMRELEALHRWVERGEPDG